MTGSTGHVFVWLLILAVFAAIAYRAIHHRPVDVFCRICDRPVAMHARDCPARRR